MEVKKALCVALSCKQTCSLSLEAFLEINIIINIITVNVTITSTITINKANQDQHLQLLANLSPNLNLLEISFRDPPPQPLICGGAPDEEVLGITVDSRD